MSTEPLLKDDPEAMGPAQAGLFPDHTRQMRPQLSTLEPAGNPRVGPVLVGHHTERGTARAPGMHEKPFTCSHARMNTE